MAFPGDIDSLVTVSGSSSLAAAGHADRHNEVKTALEGLRDGLGSTSLGSWIAYTPTLGGFTAGSGTPTSGAYIRIGKIVHFRAVWTYGSGSAAASARPTLTLPLTAAAASGASVTAVFFDVSATAYFKSAAYQTSTTVVTMGVLGTNGVSNAASTTSPMTWAAGDQIILAGTYESA